MALKKFTNHILAEGTTTTDVEKNTNYFAPAVVANIAKIEGKSSNLNFKGNVTTIDF